MITKSPTFCPAPWTSLNIDQVGETSPCFHCVDMIGNNKKNTIQEIIHGPKVTSMKEAMARGEWHPGCSWCKRLEETTGASGRTVRGASAETLAAIDTDPNFFKLEHLVVNWSNLCNLTCVYCNDQTSTAWQSVTKIPINHVKNEHADLIELAQTQGHNRQRSKVQHCHEPVGSRLQRRQAQSKMGWRYQLCLDTRGVALFRGDPGPAFPSCHWMGCKQPDET